MRLPCRVLVVDDHPLIREGLRRLLAEYSSISVVAEANSGKEAIEQVASHEPDVVIMDINMEYMNGIEATAVIKTKWPHITVLGLSMATGGETRYALLKAGAADLFDKAQAADELHAAILRYCTPRQLS